jgi:hypothetical protein
MKRATARGLMVPPWNPLYRPMSLTTPLLCAIPPFARFHVCVLCRFFSQLHFSKGKKDQSLSFDPPSIACHKVSVFCPLRSSKIHRTHWISRLSCSRTSAYTLFAMKKRFNKCTSSHGMKPWWYFTSDIKWLYFDEGGCCPVVCRDFLRKRKQSSIFW